MSKDKLSQRFFNKDGMSQKPVALCQLRWLGFISSVLHIWRSGATWAGHIHTEVAGARIAIQRGRSAVVDAATAILRERTAAEAAVAPHLVTTLLL